MVLVITNVLSSSTSMLSSWIPRRLCRIIPPPLELLSYRYVGDLFLTITNE